MKDKVSLAVIYVLSFLLMVTLAFVMVPVIISAPIFILGFFSLVINAVLKPVFNILTPVGGIALFIVLIAAILSKVVKTPNTRAAVCYLPGVGAVCAGMEYAKKEEDEFLKFHIIQGLVLFAFASVLFIASIVLINIGGVGAFLGYYLISILFIAGGLLLVYLMYNAYNGEKATLIPLPSTSRTS